MTFKKLTPRFWVSPQITEADVERAAAQGFRAIIDNRPRLSEISCEGHYDETDGGIEWRDESNQLFPINCSISFWRERTRRRLLRKTACLMS